MSQAKSIYICENCGITVQPENYYGSGRFCCPKCARSFSSRYANTEEKRKEKSNTLIFNNLSKSITNYNEVYNKIISLSDTYNLYDIEKQLSISHKTFKHIINAYNIKENPKFITNVPNKCLEFCKQYYNKDTSITVDDFNNLKELIYNYIYVDHKQLKEIAKLINFDGDMYHQVCKNWFKIKLDSSVKKKNLSNALKKYHKSIGTYNNITDKEKYLKECDFKFDTKLFPYIPNYELIKEYGWYNSTKNKNGVTRDHKISKMYGFKHNIGPKLIRHPANCEFMLIKDNSYKRINCSITIEQLLEDIKIWNEKYGEPE